MELLFQTITTVRPIPPQQTKERADADREDPTASARALSLVPSSYHGLNLQHVVEVAGVEPASPKLLVGLLRAQPMVDFG